MEIVFFLFFIMLIVFMKYYYKFSKKNQFILKIVTSSLFLLFGFVCFIDNNSANITLKLTVLIGLLFGFFGDVILGLRKEKTLKNDRYLIFGLLLFLIGHVFYTYTLANIYTIRYEYVIGLAAAITIIFITIFKLVKLRIEKVKKYIYIYIFISSLLLSVAVINIIHTNNKLNQVLVVAAISFILSDFLLAFIYFKKDNPMFKTLSIFSYYLAQIFFAYSIYLY